MPKSAFTSHKCIFAFTDGRVECVAEDLERAAGAQVRASGRRRHGELLLSFPFTTSLSRTSRTAASCIATWPRAMCSSRRTLSRCLLKESKRKNNAQISDFGLCRHRSETTDNLHERRLPIKWMALEALQRQHFDTRTDV